MEEVEEALVEALGMAETLMQGHEPSPLHKAALLKELCDVQYVLDGFFATFGLPKLPAFNRVHDSNMSKLDTNGKPVKRADGKILKGDNYKEVNLEDLV